MLEDSQIKVAAGTNSIVVSTTEGYPQSEVLSPIIWNMVVDELLGESTNTGIQVPGYGDDIVLICWGKCRNTLCDRIRTGLRIISNWCRKPGMRINAVKANIGSFTKKRKHDQLRAIGVHDEKHRWNI